jgi:hypothetical protein
MFSGNNWSKNLGELRRVFDMRGRKRRRLDAHFRRSWSNSFLRLEHLRDCGDHVLAAAKAGITGALTMVFIWSGRKIRRDITVVGRHEVAGEHFRRYEKQQKHRRKAKRLQTKAHALLFCHIWICRELGTIFPPCSCYQWATCRLTNPARAQTSVERRKNLGN